MPVNCEIYCRVPVVEAADPDVNRGGKVGRMTGEG
jgi:hypothetical protein